MSWRLLSGLGPSATRRTFSASLALSERYNDRIRADLHVLLENGWKLDEERIQLEKTYNFKTYTKVAVGYH